MRRRAAGAGVAAAPAGPRAARAPVSQSCSLHSQSSTCTTRVPNSTPSVAAPSAGSARAGARQVRSDEGSHGASQVQATQASFFSQEG